MNAAAQFAGIAALDGSESPEHDEKFTIENLFMKV